MRTLIRWAVVALGAVLVAGVVLAFATGLVGLKRLEGYYAPVFEPDGRQIYFVARETRGLVWGPGWEFFTPPASVYAFSDVLSLRRLDLATGAEEVLERWSESPITRRKIKNYRGRLFQVLGVQTRVLEPGTVEYRVRLNVTRVPRSEQHRIRGVWQRSDGGGRGEWEVGYAGLSGYDETPLHGARELIAVPGPESYPAALAAYDAATGAVRVLVQSRDFDRHYPDGIPVDLLASRSKRAAIERIQELERLRTELVARFEREGLSEGEALLRTSKELQRLGYIPKSPTLTARLLSAGAEPVDGSTPLFEIAEAEMASGIFQDIEAAISAPGTPVDKSIGRYVVHRDYTNSARLNALLESGGRVFRMRYRGRTYEVTLKRP